MVCEICKKKLKTYYKGSIFLNETKAQEITLCYHHDIELFKRGQIRFLERYKAELKKLIQGGSSALEE